MKMENRRNEENETNFFSSFNYWIFNKFSVIFRITHSMMFLLDKIEGKTLVIVEIEPKQRGGCCYLIPLLEI